MTTFALIHGGFHGGWCWELLAPELASRNHSSISPDLPIEDESAGGKEYADIVAAALEAIEDDVTLVGHSMGGLVLPLVAQIRPVNRMVFLAGLVPMPGMSNLQYLGTQQDAIVLPGAGKLSRGELPVHSDHGISWELAKVGFYHDVPDEIARRAWGRLRKQSPTIMTEPSTLQIWPDVPCTYILMSEDHAVGGEWSRRRAAEIGADIIELGGSHSPFYSRPGQLAEILDGLSS